jgi:hypothetical protein
MEIRERGKRGEKRRRYIYREREKRGQRGEKRHREREKRERNKGRELT